MLFSDDRIAQFIHQHFEPVWEAVRPVPRVTIDFGGGHVLTRTLNGNIATSACHSDGQLLDVLPGIYEPHTYLQQLDQFVQLHRWVQQQGDVAAALTRYHQRQAEALAEGKPPLVVAPAPAPLTKYQIERPLKLVLRPGPAGGGRMQHAPPDDGSPGEPRHDRQRLAGWPLLAEDTRINQQVRRLAIHRHLVQQGPVTPADITRWLYREVLDADLDDPYLGLGQTLFAGYPFRDQ
ncbi:MAG: hypothetical protein GTO03_14945 [Planctomycetales bacterium]|nr:hypothetical protein [Planctomycetales bacterium]